MTSRGWAFVTGAALLLSMWVNGAMAAESGASTPPPATDAQGGGSLSDKLSTTNGVIHPQTNVDPGMGKVPPQTDSVRTPVIPPPGTPGGTPDVQPK